MLNGFQSYAQNYSQIPNTQWPYVEAKNYSDWESILQVFPHLKTVNSHLDLEAGQNVTGIVIRSANDDNVHKVHFKLYRRLNMEFGQPPLKIEARFSSYGKENLIIT